MAGLLGCVCATTAVVLNIATPATLHRYAKRFEKRCAQYTRAWHLAVQAEDRCRNEFWLAERRRQERLSKTMPGLSAFIAGMPSESVIKEATTNVEFWMNSFQEQALIHTKIRGDSNPSWVKQQPYEERGQKRTWQEVEDSNASSTKSESVEVCRNLNQGKCVKKDGRFRHICYFCGGNHQALECKEKGTAKKGKGMGKKGSKGVKGEKL